MLTYHSSPAAASTSPVGEPAQETHAERVRAIEDAILNDEGAFHVAGRYFANAEDASRQRRWVAERIAREVERAARYALTAAGRRLLAS